MSRASHQYFHIKIHRSINTVLIVFFLLAQSVTLLHAEIHDFHDHEEYCDTFKSLEKHHFFIGVAATPICAIPPNKAQTAFHWPKVPQHKSVFYEARASPALIPP
jgi:hypothetical protein